MGYPFAFSYTFLDAEESCPEKARRLFITKDFKRQWTQAMTGGVDAHTAVEQRVKARTPLPEEHQRFEPFIASLEKLGPLETELALGVDHWIKPVSFWAGWLRGKLDIVHRNREKKTAVLADWKTGKRYEKELQLEIGALLLMEADPAIDTVIGMNIWLKEGKAGQPYRFTRIPSPFDLLGRSARWARLIRRMRLIEERPKEAVWEKRPGPLCPWCPVTDCENFRGGTGQ